MEDAKQLITLILIIFGAAAAVFHFASEAKDNIVLSLAMHTTGIGLLYFIIPVVNAAEHKAHAGYRLYVASAIHATVLHHALGIYSHLWMDMVVQHAKEAGEWDSARSWQEQIEDKWKLYKDKDRNENLHQSYTGLLATAKCAAELAIVGSVLLWIFQNLVQ